MNIESPTTKAPGGYRAVEAELSQDLVAMVERVIDRDQRISALQRGSDKLRHQVRDEQSKRKAAEAAVTELRNKIKYLRSENSRVSQEADKREADRAKDILYIRRKYENSSSWRITAPIRAIARLFGR